MARETPLLAVLIDADNTSHSWAEPIFEEIAALGEAGVRRAYGDFTSTHLKGWQAKLAPLALVPQHSPANTVGKNSSDISLVIDAMDLLHTGRFDGFVLVSSDSDFTRLASRIREQGLDVFGIGQRKTPEAFRNACKRFIYIENLIHKDPVPVAAPVLGEPVAAAPVSDKLSPRDAIPLIVAAMRTVGGDEEWYTLGQIGQYITQANPDFDTRTYGAKSLSDLVRRSGRFEVKQGPGGQLIIADLA